MCNQISMKIVLRLSLFLVLGVLSVQLIGCGSAAELSSAKLYREQRNYIKAEQLLEQALAKDPTSDDVWALYVKNLFDLKKYEKIAEVIDTASVYAVKNRAEVEFVRRNTWIELYNGAVAAYQQNPDSREQQQASIGLLQSAIKVYPDQPEAYELLGDVYYSAGDTEKYISTYETALRQVRSLHDQGVALGLTLKMNPADAESAIGGAPARMTTLPLQAEGDSILIYSYPSKEAYIYFVKTKKQPKYMLHGWRFTTSEALGYAPLAVSLQPYKSIAQVHLDRGNAALARKDKATAEREFDQAVPLLIAVQRLDPSDQSAASIIPDIYRQLGDVERAKSEYERMLAERPSKQLYSSYGVVLMNSSDYQGAIDAFNKALEIDAGFENALFNIGATYQNWAVVDSKKGTKDASKEMYTKLEKAVEYFEKVYAINKQDFTSIGYLIENYEILGKPDKSKTYITALDNLKSTSVGNNPDYWNLVGKVYAKVDPAKAAEAYKKADSLRK
jgi:tetratricopeptide (TPR) repeat protein